MKRFYVSTPAGLTGPYAFAADARFAARMCGGLVVAMHGEPAEHEKAAMRERAVTAYRDTPHTRTRRRSDEHR